MLSGKVDFDGLKSQLSTQLEKSALYKSAESWYNHLGDRDRLMIKVLAACVALTLVYMLLFKPLQAGLAKAESRYSSEKNTLEWVLENEPAAKRLSKSSSSSAGGQSGSILSTVRSSARQQGLSLKKYEPEGTDGLRVWLEDAPFNKMMSWLSRLDQTKNVQVKSITIDKQKSEGLVDARAVLGRK